LAESLEKFSVDMKARSYDPELDNQKEMLAERKMANSKALSLLFC